MISPFLKLKMLGVLSDRILATMKKYKKIILQCLQRGRMGKGVVFTTTLIAGS